MQLHAALLLTLFAVASAQLRCSVDTACKQDYAAFTFETEGAVTVGCSYLTSTGTSPAVKDVLCADPTIKYGCPATCDGCSCTDDIDFRFVANMKSQNCNWIFKNAKKRNKRRAKYCPTAVGAYCPHSCGFCPDNLETCHMASYKREFSPLAGKPGANILDVSCTQSWHEQVEIGFPFPYGNSTISSVIVDTNGQLKLDLNDTQTNYCTAVPLGGHGKPRFAFSNGNLAPITFGDVTVCRTTNSFVISFEEVESFSETNMAAGGRINASIKLFRNGSIQICYGSLTMAVKPSDNCAGGLIAGIEDGNIKIPIAGVTDGDGAFLGDAFPAPGCYQKESANDFFAPIV